MSRAIENYICASEDRPHYNNETNYLYGFYHPMRTPHVTNIQIINKYETDIPEEKINELIDARIPQLKESVMDEIGEIVVPLTGE